MSSEIISKYKYKALKINGKRIDEHRYVMECHLGRKLLTNEVVRHKDKNTLNNDINNLYLITRQQQFKEQLAAGELSKAILEGLKKKADGIKKKRIRQYIPKIKKVKEIKDTVLYLKKKHRVFETKIIDTTKLIPIKCNKRTTVYVKEDTLQSEIDRIIKKHNPK